MSYEPTNWKAGDTVTSAKLNKLEQGIAAASGGGGVLVVHFDTNTLALDKTYSEIKAAAETGIVVIQTRPSEYFMMSGLVTTVVEPPANTVYGIDGISFMIIGESVITQPMQFITDSANGYPTIQTQGDIK